MPDVYIRYIELPWHINALTIPNCDATFDVYVNSCICQSRQQEAINHELAHIGRDHFYNDTSSIETIEIGADEGA